MDKNRFYELLDIEDGSDFQYFENIADLMEMEERASEDLISVLLREMELEDLDELLAQYFNEIESFDPDGETEFFTLLSSIRQVLASQTQMSIRAEDPANTAHHIGRLADEIGNFRDWYSLTENVECTEIESGKQMRLPVRDALGLARAEKLGGEQHYFDFTDALSYELDELVMSFSDLADYSAES